MHKHTSTILAFSIFAGLMPAHAIAQNAVVPHEQDFVLTAYYSPLPDQCCYVKGSYEADKILNGNGTHGADGTAVYAGMIAAPASYPFGTRIVLPGLGTFTVHDRGGAIQEWDDAHRIDVWAGAGEEGLARALEFGVQKVRGTVYLAGTDMPGEEVSLEDMPAPDDQLQAYIAPDASVSSLHASAGQQGFSVRVLQENLATLGYFNHDATGLYGLVTQESVTAFNADMNLNEPSDHVSEVTAAYLQAALSVDRTKSPIVFVGKESNEAEVKTAQRTMRYLGYYRGRTDGKYSSILFNAILSYQRDQKLVGDAVSPGAGRIGPMTKGTLDKEIIRRRVARLASRILAMNEVRDQLQKDGALVAAQVSKGSNGAIVRSLQTFLADRGFFPHEKINGNFGDLTAKSVAAYQVARELLNSEKEKGAGTVGPVTLNLVRQEQVKAAYAVVKAKGWDAL